jgi:hypothetical protein
MRYRVARWDRDKQRGYIVDRTGYEYLVTAANLAPECDGQIVEGDLVSGVALETTVNDILIEKGSNPIRERKEFESKGVQPVGSWDPHKPGVVPGRGLNRIGK